MESRGEGKEQVNGCYGEWVPLRVVTSKFKYLFLSGL